MSRVLYVMFSVFASVCLIYNGSVAKLIGTPLSASLSCEQMRATGASRC